MRILAVCAILILNASLTTSALSQSLNSTEDKEKRQDPRSKLTPTNKMDLERLRTPKTPLVDLRSELEEGFVPFEGPLDPNTYFVGPGDQFLITFSTSLEDAFVSLVTPEAKLVIHTLGSIDVDGKTLSEVRELVKQVASTKYLNVNLQVDLIRVRSIRVHVTGQVKMPGTYDAFPTQRVSDLIESAEGLTSWASERNIQVRHRDGTVEEIDLYRFKKMGDIDANLFLRAGDVIFVPSIDLSKPAVRVEGLVDDPGVYQLNPGETLPEFLLRVDAFSRRTDLKYAYLTRGGNDSHDGTTDNIPLFPYLSQKGNGHAGFLLQDGDVIMIPQRKEDVYVIGAVQNPGAYPYVPGLKVAGYVGFAGGMYQAVELRKVRLTRSGESKGEKDVVLKEVFPGDVIYVPRKRDFGLQEAAAIMAALATTVFTIDRVVRP